MSSRLIRLRNIARRYLVGGDIVSAIDDVSLDIDRNEYVAFTGTSGSGKSTMMNIIGCLDLFDEGTYELNGLDVRGLDEAQLASIRNREIGFIFQSFNLLTKISAVDNVMRPLIYRGMPRSRCRSLARAALARVGMTHRESHLPSQLSGGQRQRVAIARALCAEPSLLIADEPTGNLDSATGAEVMSLFDALHKDGQTVIVVTHEEEVARHCTRQVVLKDGRVESDVATGFSS